MNDPQATFFKSVEAKTFPFGLGSDNHSGAHPRILKAIEAVNFGFAPSYGTDVVTDEAVRVLRAHFGPQTDVHFCFNGTAANILALAPFVQSYNSIICSEMAHINVDECAAGEKLLGTKLITVPSKDGKISPAQIEPYIIRRGDQHFAQVKAVSITQPTELGAVYTRKEISDLVAFCAKHDLWLHVDGARFINAATQLKCSLRQVVEGVDSLSFGGTKNGILFGEAVLFLSERARKAARDFPYIRKQFMQLPSKTRFVAAQFVELMGTDLWQQISQNSLDRAQQLRDGIEQLRAASSVAFDKIRITQPSVSNVVFVIFDRAIEKAVKKEAFFYIWDEATREARLMTSWNTTSEDINRILETIKVAATQNEAL